MVWHTNSLGRLHTMGVGVCRTSLGMRDALKKSGGGEAVQTKSPVRGGGSSETQTQKLRSTTGTSKLACMGASEDIVCVFYNIHLFKP